MNDEQFIRIYELGLNNISNGQLFTMYHYITNKQLGGSCSSCALRQAKRTISDYYNKIK